MIILGVDPSVNHLGWGIITVDNNSAKYLASGTIYTNPSLHITAKLAKIFSKLEAVINDHNITIVVTENVYLDKDLTATLSLSYARAVIMTLTGKNALEFYEVNASNIKKTITGSGRASKEQVKYMVETLLKPAKPESQDEADALAMAYTCFIAKTTSSKLIDLY